MHAYESQICSRARMCIFERFKLPVTRLQEATMRYWNSLLLVLTLVIVGCGRGGAIGVPVVGGIEFSGSVTTDGKRHSFLLYVPGQDVLDDNVPMIINLHGGGASLAGHEGFSRLRVTAVQRGFAVLSPAGYKRTWNAGDCCDPALDEDIDHVRVIREMIAEAADIIDLDRSRVYATGFSNGAMMAYRLACEASDVIAAIAPVAGTLVNRDLDGDGADLFACQPSRSVPVLHFHGRSDSCAPFDGGASTGPDGGMRPPVADSIERFRQINACSVSSQTETVSGDTRCETWSTCSGNAEVVLCSQDKAGHVWPGTNANPNESSCGGQGTDDLDANERMWGFLRRFSI